MPRLTDKFLGECGSRRFAQRAEIDEHDDNPGEEDEYKRWGEEVYAALQSLPDASAPPVCDWTVPQSRIAEFHGDDDGESTALRDYSFFSAIFAVVVGMVWYLQREVPQSYPQSGY